VRGDAGGVGESDGAKTKERTSHADQSLNEAALSSFQSDLIS
jgi:hypothetical protein